MSKITKHVTALNKNRQTVLYYYDTLNNCIADLAAETQTQPLILEEWKQVLNYYEESLLQMSIDYELLSRCQRLQQELNTFVVHGGAKKEKDEEEKDEKDKKDNPNYDEPTETLQTPVARSLFLLGVNKSQLRVHKQSDSNDSSSFLWCLQKSRSSKNLRRRLQELVESNFSLEEALIVHCAPFSKQYEEKKEALANIEKRMEELAHELSKNKRLSKESSRFVFAEIQDYKNKKKEGELAIKEFVEKEPRALVHDEDSLAKAILDTAFPVTAEMQSLLLRDLDTMAFLFDPLRRRWIYRFAPGTPVAHYILLKIGDSSKGEFQLIEYKGKTTFSFEDLPFGLVNYVWQHRNPYVEDSWPANHPQWTAYDTFRQTAIPYGVTAKMQEAHQLAHPVDAYEKEMQLERSGLYHPDIVLTYSLHNPGYVDPEQSAYDQLPVDVLPHYTKLMQTFPDWREKLDDSYLLPCPFAVDGCRWASVEHYLRACPYKQ
jgi:hypothetical protein